MSVTERCSKAQWPMMTMVLFVDWECLASSSIIKTSDLGALEGLDKYGRAFYKKFPVNPSFSTLATRRSNAVGAVRRSRQRTALTGHARSGAPGGPACRGTYPHISRLDLLAGP